MDNRDNKNDEDRQVIEFRMFKFLKIIILIHK